jgi:hypothetical protein
MKNVASNSWFLRVIMAIALIVIAWLAATVVIPPRPIPANAPATSFSAERAMQDLEVIASEPHPAGSPAQARVRDYIVDQAASAGLQAEIQKSVIIENVLVRLAGTDSTRTVLVTGHYDSNFAAPGAGDNGITVAAMLEAIRVLRANPPLRNDLLFLFTDGEEIGWKGASLFIKKYPDAKQEIGLVLCFDARPGNAPLTLRQTTHDDAWLVKELSRIDPPMYAGSWTNPEERTDEDTDFTVFAATGYIGFEIENDSAGSRYHTPRDTVEAISPDLVQSYGDSIIGMARHFGNLDLSTIQSGEDRIYFTLPLAGVVKHPAWVMPFLACLGLAALIAIILPALRKGTLSLNRTLLSTILLLAGILLVAGIAELIWQFAILDSQSVKSIINSAGEFDGSNIYVAWLMAGAAILVMGLIYAIARWRGVVNLATAGVLIYILIWVIAFLFLEAANPLTTPYIAWPFLGGVAGLAVLIFVQNPYWKLALLILCVLPIFGLLIPVLILEHYSLEEVLLFILMFNLMFCLIVSQLGVVFGLPETTGMKFRATEPHHTEIGG